MLCHVTLLIKLVLMCGLCNVLTKSQVKRLLKAVFLMIFSVKIVMINLITFWFGNIHKRYQNLLKIILVINSTQIER